MIPGLIASPISRRKKSSHSTLEKAWFGDLARKHHFGHIAPSESPPSEAAVWGFSPMPPLPFRNTILGNQHHPKWSKMPCIEVEICFGCQIHWALKGNCMARTVKDNCAVDSSLVTSILNLWMLIVVCEEFFSGLEHIFWQLTYVNSQIHLKLTSEKRASRAKLILNRSLCFC